jgi:hypothetical protein
MDTPDLMDLDMGMHALEYIEKKEKAKGAFFRDLPVYTATWIEHMHELKIADAGAVAAELVRRGEVIEVVNPKFHESFHVRSKGFTWN